MKKNIFKTIITSDRILLLAVVCSTFIIFWVGIQTKFLLDELLEQSRRSKILSDCLNDIRHLDEVLTNSARLAANSGEQQWLDRYHFYEPKLNEAIKKAIRIEPSEVAQNKLMMVDSANIKLVALEHRALDLVQGGKPQEAKLLLTESEYELEKENYATELALFIDILNQKNFERDTLIDRRTNHYYYIFFIAVAFSILVWIPLLNLRRNSRKALIKNNRLLEEEVQKRLQNEAALMMFEQTFKSVNDVINIADLNDNIVFVNPAFCKTYGYTEEELIGKNSSIFWSEHNPKEVVEQILPATLNGGWKGELFNKRKDGTEFPIYLSTSVIKNDSGEQIAVVGIVEDITERKREDLERRVMQEITEGVTATSHLDELLKLIHTSLKKIIYAENCFVALYDSSTELFSFPYWVDKFDPIPEPEPVGRGCAAYVFRTGKPLLVTEETFEQLIKRNQVELVGSPSPSWVGVPLVSPERTIGVLVLQHYEEMNIYSERDIHFLSSVGSQIALVIERKRAEEELINERLLLRTVIDNIPDSIYCKDLNGRKTLANITELRYSGAKSEKEILGKTDFDFYPKELAEGFFADDQLVVQTGNPVLNREEFVLDEFGQRQWLLTSKLPLKDEKGSIVGIVGIGHNITSRKQAEEALRENEVKLNVILQSTADGILAVDSSGKVIKTNERFAQLWRIPQYILDSGDDNMLLGFILEQLIDSAEFLTKVKKLYNSKEKDLDHLYFKDGRIFERYSAPLVMSGSSLGRVWSFRDITETKRAEEEIKKQNEQLLKINAEKDKFFSIIAHDLRSPFQGFLVLTEMLTENINEFSIEEIGKYLGELNKSTQNIYKLLQNLLDWAQLKKGSFDFTPAEFSLSTVVSTNIEQINKRAIQKGITIINEVPEDQKVFVDERMINSILGNLLSNAVKFTNSEGKIAIKAKTIDNGMVEIAIEDTGVGMTERTLNRLFKIDEKVGRKGTDGELSTGLGLLLSKEFVEKHNGKIWAESEEGKGSCFMFTIPFSG